jgi:hypothetical protein
MVVIVAFRSARIRAVSALWRAAILIASVVSMPAGAQWTVTTLHPPGAEESFGRAAFGDRQGGDIRQGPGRPCIWNGSADGWIDLTPPGGVIGTVNAMSDTHEVGYVVIPPQSFRAALWSGTAASRVDLHPEGARQSFGYGVRGSQQVGFAVINDVNRAALWHGTAASFVDLSPPGSTNSFAYGTDGSQQVGYARIGDTLHASLWTGSAASWTSLNPSNAEAGLAYATHGSRQVGHVYIRWQNIRRAAMWSGTAASWIDLHPPGSTFSSAVAIHGDYQAGIARTSTADRAAVWKGTAASCVDLHAVLPSRYTSSEAAGVWSDATIVRVVGTARNGDTGRREAVLWTMRVGPTVFRVDLAAPVGGDGVLWSTAFNDLQDALDAARGEPAPVEIWIARGAYRPDRGTQRRDLAFDVPPGVTLIGGFAGTETASTQHDPLSNPTILSGDLGNAPLNSSRVVTVVTAGDSPAAIIGCTISDAVVDFATTDIGGGVQVIAARLDLTDCVIENHLGRLPMDYTAPPAAGIVARGGADVRITRCRISRVIGEPDSIHPYPFGQEGGVGWGIVCHASTLAVTDCIIAQNTGGDGGNGNCTAGFGWDGGNGGNGGGISLEAGSNAMIVNSTFIGNGPGGGGSGGFCNVHSGRSGSPGSGGGLAVSGSTFTLINCTLASNTTAFAGHLTGCVIRNSIVWNDRWSSQAIDAGASITHSSLPSAFPGVGNRVGSPMFVDMAGVDGIAGTQDDDLRLDRDSACIDAGDNTALPPGTTTDLDHAARFVDAPGVPDTGTPGGDGGSAVVDMGAFEWPITRCPGDHNRDGGIDGSDITAFFADWQVGDAAADLDRNGGVDGGDIVFFFARWEGGC